MVRLPSMFLSKIPLIVDGGLKGLIKRLVVVVVAAGALCAGGLMAHIAVLGNELPDLSSMENYDPAVTSKVFDKNGNLVARFYEERRTVVAIEQMPEHVKKAFVAAEDEDFYNHKGIDYLAIVRAVVYQVRHKLIGGRQSGGSTITQQTAKTFLLTPERSMSRKIKEMILAKKIEERFSKDHILYLYLNQIYFGNGAYGIEEAARTYYGCSVDKLTVGQAAVLASIPKSPSRINPWADPRRVRVRRGYVLEQMRINGFIDEAQEKKGNEEPVRVDVAPPEFLDVAPYYAEAIRRELADRTSPEEVARGGLTVYAALDGSLQRAANVAVDKGLRELDKRQGYRGALLRLDPDEARELLALLDDERARRFPADETPDLKREPAEGRAIWDLGRVKLDDVQRMLKAAAAVVDDEDADVSEAEQKLDAQLAQKAGLSTSPPMRQVRTTRLKIGGHTGAVVKDVDNAGKKVIVDLGTVDAVMPFASMTWARSFAPEKATERPKTPADVVKKGDIILVTIEKIVPARSASKDKAGSKTTARAASVEVSLEQEPKAQGALVSIDPADHRVLALVGGSDFAASPFNRATQAVRQAGSSFKPFIYATGIETRLFSSVGFLDAAGGPGGGVQHRLITDAPKVFFDRWTGKKWAPQNSSGRFLGDITTRTCLTHSVNTCSISILEKVGVDAVLDVATKVHLNLAEEPFPKNQTLALGTGGVHLLDLVNAYAVFPDGGRFAAPVLIEKVKRRDGSILMEAAPIERTQVFSPQTASIMADMMQSVVESGTATRARELKRPVAGKTGTTDGARSVWFVGFTPDVVTGVYVGFDDNKTLGRAESGGRAAVPIWLRFMQVAVADEPVRSFALSEGVVRKSVDVRSGLLARSEEALSPGELPEPELNDDGDPIPKVLPAGVIGEVFVTGTEPVQTADDAPPPPLELQEQGGLAP
ncbi:MAG: PBP1A family penicillin-binding protein [Deltaproteobacteria bacterium]|nr:PBP1A family penicillin-binding protein [Deltaproteobacteria bacterium]